MPAHPDPEPDDSTGLAPGPGVPPGETPPDSGSVSPVRSTALEGKERARPWLLVAVVAAVLLAVVLLVLGLTGLLV